MLHHRASTVLAVAVWCVNAANDPHRLVRTEMGAERSGNLETHAAIEVDRAELLEKSAAMATGQENISTREKFACFDNPTLQAGEWVAQNTKAPWYQQMFDWMFLQGHNLADGSLARWRFASEECQHMHRFLELPDGRLDMQCVKQNSWTLLVGDSNIRKLFNTLVTRLEQQEGIKFDMHEPSKPGTDHRWGDREVVHAVPTNAGTNDAHVPSFRLSFMFLHNASHPFYAHANDGRWDLNKLLESDGSPESFQADAPSGKANPDNIIFYAGLWDLDCGHMTNLIQSLTDQLPETRLLYVPAGAISYHPTITSDKIKTARKCGASWFQNASKVSKSRYLGFLDLWPMTSSAPAEWKNKGGGFHYTESCDCTRRDSCDLQERPADRNVCDFRNGPSPIAREMLGLFWSFICG